MQIKDTMTFDPENPPRWVASHWLNCSSSVSLEDLRGRVVVLIFFQTHCNGSRQHVLPQAERLFKAFNNGQLAVVGLNAPFENKASQQPAAVRSFVKANKLHFPIGIDAIEPSGLPHTMNAYQVQGTPALLIFDRDGRLRRHYLGGIDDIRLSAEIMSFILDDDDATFRASLQTEQVLAQSLTEPEHRGMTENQHNHLQAAQLPWHAHKIN